KGFIPPAEAFMDMSRLRGLVQYMVQKGVYLNPTMRMTWAGSQAFLDKEYHHEEFALLFGNWNLRYIPLDWKLANLKEFFEIDLWNRDDLTPYDRDLFEQGYKNAQTLIKAYVDGGGKLYSGTDCASFCVPGLAMHQEMELLVDAGVTPLQALQASTIHPAEMLRMQDRLGMIAEGMAADLLVLSANPLENISNTRKIAKVISRGKVLDVQYHADFENTIPSSDREASSHYFPSPRIRLASWQRAILTVQGTGFIPYSIIVMNGQKLKTEFIDEFQLRAVVPEQLLKLGTFPVTVENPNFGTIGMRGIPDLSRLGILDYVSNTFSLIISPGMGRP
ncbi:MAG: amidohydrolase family protein, partial [Terriglobia bacterium]